MTGNEIDAGLDRRLADAVERLGNGLRSLAQQTARAQGLTPLQQQVILALVRQPPDRREVNALAAEFGVTTPTMSDAVGALDRKQLITRSPGPDGRRRRLGLTELGEQAAHHLAAWDSPLTKAIAKLPADDRATTLHSLLRVIADLQGDGVITVARACTTCRFFRPGTHPDRAAPHHCELLRTPLPLAGLQTDCPEHEQAA